MGGQPFAACPAQERTEFGSAGDSSFREPLIDVGLLKVSEGLLRGCKFGQDGGRRVDVIAHGCGLRVRDRGVQAGAGS